MTKEEFWKWFTINSDRYMMVDELEEAEQNKLFDALQENLDAYQEGLDYEISDLTSAGRELMISAQGDIELFEAVVSLLEAAPELDWWEFIPFRQPQGNDLIIHFDKMKYDTTKMYILPLENEEEPTVFGLRIAMPNFIPDDEDMEVAAYLCVEATIGELDTATLVGFIEAVPLPENIEGTGFLPFSQLMDYVEWFKDTKKVDE